MNDKTITIENNRIIVQFPYSKGLIDRVKQLYGRTYDTDTKTWSFPAAPMYAKQAVIFGNEHSFTVSGDVLKLSRFNLNPVVKLDRTPLYPYQTKAVDFIHDNGMNCLVADDMGVGKTIEALWAIKESPNTKRILIVSPASVIYKWRDEVKKWLELDALVIKTSKDDVPNEDGVHIVSYDLLHRMANKMDNLRYDVMILDECHAISHKETKRSKAVKAIHTKARIMMSGTPFLNRPIELWNILNTLNPYKWDNYWAYARRYADAHMKRMGRIQFMDVSGASNIPELREVLKPIMIRRLKEDVLKDLPELTRTILPVDIEQMEYRKALHDLKGWLKKEGKDYNRANALVKLNYLRQLTGLGKVKHAVEFAQDFLSSSDERKLVIYCHHREVVNQITAELQEWGVDTIVGDDSQQKRADTIRKFQEKTLPRVLVISSAGGEGVDLFAADTILTVEPPWNKATMEQAEARLHRLGQKNAVNSYFLLANDTIDKDIYELIQEKDSVISGILGDKDKINWILDRLS